MLESSHEFDISKEISNIFSDKIKLKIKNKNLFITKIKEIFSEIQNQEERNNLLTDYLKFWEKIIENYFSQSEKVDFINMLKELVTNSTDFKRINLSEDEVIDIQIILRQLLKYTEIQAGVINLVKIAQEWEDSRDDYKSKLDELRKKVVRRFHQERRIKFNFDNHIKRVLEFLDFLDINNFLERFLYTSDNRRRNVSQLFEIYSVMLKEWWKNDDLIVKEVIIMRIRIYKKMLILSNRFFQGELSREERRDIVIILDRFLDGIGRQKPEYWEDSVGCRFETEYDEANNKSSRIEPNKK